MHRRDMGRETGKSKQTKGQIDTVGDRCDDVGVGTVCGSAANVSV